MTKKIILLAVLLLSVSTPLALAETDSTSTSAKPQARKEELMRKKENALSLLLEDKNELQSEYREKIQALKLQFKAKREEFENSLLELKDLRKKAIIERTDKRLETINQNWAQRMNASILRLENLLAKFSTRSAALKAEGQNTDEVDLAINNAETAIQTAKETVAIQAAKEYIADLSDDQNLRSNVGESMSSLRADLKLAHESVKIAKQKVIDVARALAKLKGSTVIPSAEPTQSSTPSATVSPSI